MVTIKNKIALQKMREAGRILASLMEDVGGEIREGRSTLAIELFIADKLNKCGMVSRTKGYKGYQHVSCISVNDELVHGVPKSNRILKAGDYVKVDICASRAGYCADMSRPFFVGNVSRLVKKIVLAAERALFSGVTAALPGGKVGDVSAAIQGCVEAAGFEVVRDYAGHGIGKSMHEEPEVLNYGKAGVGPALREGMTLAIEPMVTQGDCGLFVDRDGWTVRTTDGGLAAHVEDTVAITSEGPEILTRIVC